MADYRLDTEYSTETRPCGCETTYNSKGEPVYEKVCAMHRCLTTCGVCYAVVWRDDFDAHVEWHSTQGVQ